jgi:succinate dehydrogenase/fumarate reductase flavoprotein subunit
MQLKDLNTVSCDVLIIGGGGASLWAGVGVIRDEGSMQKALSRIEELKSRGDDSSRENVGVESAESD